MGKDVSQDKKQADMIIKILICFSKDLHKLHLFGKENQLHVVKRQSVKSFYLYKSRLVKAFKKIKKVFLEEKFYTVMLHNTKFI